MDTAACDLYLATEQAVYNGHVLKGYRVDSNGNIWSFKRDTPRIKTPNNSPAAKGYPRCGFYINGKTRGVPIHRIVAESLIPIPLPTGFRKSIWKQMNEAEKAVLMQVFEVNHIDHNTYNYHPSNLEWVTRKENRDKAYIHYGGRFN